VAEARPLISRTELTKSALFRSRPVPGADTATVFLDRRGRLYQVDRPLTPGEVAWDTPKALFEVDTAVHTMAFELQLPAAEEAFSFTAKIVVQWRIGDPRTAVESKLSDPESVIRPGLEQRLRDISRGYPIERSADAERDIRTRFAAGPITLAQGITLVACAISVSLDAGAQSHVASRTHAIRKRERLQSDHDTMQLNTQLAIQQASTKQQLEQQQAMFAQQLAQQEAQHKLLIERMNMEFYSQALNEGNLNLIALRLSTNRDDVNDVINLFMRQRELDYEGARGMLNSLLENRLVNKRDVADIMARATAVVADHMTKAPFGMDWARNQQPAVPPAPDPAGIAAAASISPAVVVDRNTDEDNDDAFDDDDLDDD
jgi:hypothetical protein